MTDTEGRWSKWPIDFESLTIPDFIPEEEIAEKSGIQPPDSKADRKAWREYMKRIDLHKMQLCQAIVSYFRIERGESWVIARNQFRGIEIVHASQATPVNRSAIARSRRSLLKACIRQLAIPTEQLTDDQKAEKQELDRKAAFWLQQNRKRPPPELTG